MNTKKVWFVTGASKGLGFSLVKKLVAEGYSVAATTRTAKNLETEIGMADNFLALGMKLTDEQSVNDAVARTITRFGKLDVVVNNAGYGKVGALEELTDQEARENFDVNVFGALNVIRSVMPHLRRQGSGHIINVASIAGILGSFPGFGVYCATKFAMAGFTESLAAEAAELGVRATVVYPGYFRTNFLDNRSLQLPQHPVAAYTAVRNSEHWHETEMKGNQPGSPEKAAEAFVQLAEMERPPLHFVMGTDAFGMARGKLNALDEALKANETLSKSTDF